MIKSFRDFINEAPINLYDVYELPGFQSASTTHIKTILSKNLPKHTFNSKYQYTIDDNYFALYEDDSLIFYIYFNKCKNHCMHVKMVDKKTNTPGISILVYNFILTKLGFKEIETGNKLSDKNISLHSRMVGHISPFKIYVRYNGEDTLISNKKELQQEINKNNKNSSFVIKESDVGTTTVQWLNYDSEDLFLQEVINNIENYTNKEEENMTQLNALRTMKEKSERDS